MNAFAKHCFVFIMAFNLAATMPDKRARRRERILSGPGLVPQLLANYTAPSLPPADEVSCNSAYLSCAYRGGCGMALKQYQLSCTDLSEGLTTTCSSDCKLALIALLSTPEGSRLMKCDCDNETDCTMKKARVEPCRSEVTWNTAPDSKVSCTSASWICMADPLCAKALEYYNSNCDAMFRGRKCSRRCKNSLDILLRQKAARKLASCWCQPGPDQEQCLDIRRNTDVLCFNRKTGTTPVDEIEQHESGGGSSQKQLNFVMLVMSLYTSYLVSELGHTVSLLLETLQR